MARVAQGENAVHLGWPGSDWTNRQAPASPWNEDDSAGQLCGVVDQRAASYAASRFRRGENGMTVAKKENYGLRRGPKRSTTTNIERVFQDDDGAVGTVGCTKFAADRRDEHGAHAMGSSVHGPGVAGVGDLVLTFCCPGEPRPQGSKTIMPTKSGRRVLVEASDTKLRVWRGALVVAARMAMAPGRLNLDEPVVLSAQFFIARPAGHTTAKGRLRAGKPLAKQSVPDLSKYIRALEDAMTDAGVWKDDSLVCGYRDVRKDYSKTGWQGVIARVYRWVP